MDSKESQVWHPSPIESRWEQFWSLATSLNQQKPVKEFLKPSFLGILYSGRAGPICAKVWLSHGCSTIDSLKMLNNLLNARLIFKVIVSPFVGKSGTVLSLYGIYYNQAQLCQCNTTKMFFFAFLLKESGYA